MLNSQWLDELRSRIALSGVIGRTTRLTKAGREFKACCPFHNEKTPSFTVNDEKGFYHCFGCGAHGDAIRWMTDQRGLSFMDAVKELAAEAGMDVPAPDPRAARQAEKRDSLHDVVTAAQAWFVDNLNSVGGAAARAYLEKRGFDAHTIARFGFGYALDDRRALKRALARFPEAMLVETGLLIQVEGRESYDRFRGRIMLPIQDARGRVVAFGGRILDANKTDAPKYLNSPETPLFDKGRTLYNLHRAAPIARQTGRLIVVEGYMDVVALSAAGIDECIAPLGTALTEQQIEMLWRHVDRPVLCFDGDTAGQRAAMRAVTRALPLLRPAHSLKIVQLPSGLDPDDLVRRQGPEAMERVLANTKTITETLWAAERDAADVRNREDIAALKQRLRDLASNIQNSDVRAQIEGRLLQEANALGQGIRNSDAYRFKKRKPGQWLNESLSRANAPVLQRAYQHGGARDALSAAVLAGLIRWPGEVARHAEALARTPNLDSRFAALLDHYETTEALESANPSTIWDRHTLEVPGPAEYSGLRFGFLVEDAQPEAAALELAQAIDLLVERPALDAALAAATVRLESELSEEAYAEQQRLLKRRLEFDKRLRHMATQRSNVP